ncbi:YjeJ family protein [Shigella sonnei]
MAISIKGVNIGVIRKSNNFIALALKIKAPRNKESLFFMSAMAIARPSDCAGKSSASKHELDAAARLQYEQARNKSLRNGKKISQKFWLMSLKCRY